jgi:hypothetical protein
MFMSCSFLCDTSICAEESALEYEQQFLFFVVFSDI